MFGIHEWASLASIHDDACLIQRKNSDEFVALRLRWGNTMASIKTHLSEYALLVDPRSSRDLKPANKLR